MPLLLVLATVLVAAEGRPRLLLSVEDVPALRTRVTQEPFAAMAARLAQRLDAAGDPGDQPDPEAEGLYRHAVRDLATMHLLTGDPAYAARAAAIAREMITDRRFWNDPTSKGLTRAMGAVQVAVAYDLCWPAWEPAFRAEVETALALAARGLMAGMGAGANTSIANNWQAVRYGAAGLAALACDDPALRPIAVEAYAQLKRHLVANLGGGVWNPEGIGYTTYPWGFTGPFGVAAERAGLGDLRRDVPLTRGTLWTTLVGTVPIPTRPGQVGLRADLSDDHALYTGDGTAGLAFWYATPDEVPFHRWMYDRLHGPAGDGGWDGQRAGTLYSLLWYPADVAPRDPAEDGRHLFTDRTQGVAVLRNAFRDEHDIVLTANATARKAVGGHSGPDTNTIRLIGLGALFITGGGRTGDTAGQTNLFAGPPPDTAPGGFGRLLEAVDRGGGSGWAWLSGSCLGVAEHRRGVAIDVGADSGAAAALVNADSSRDGTLWRLNTPGCNRIDTTAGGFIITAPNGARLAATIVHPAGAALRTGRVERGGGANHVAFPYRGTVTIDNAWVEMDVAGDAVVAMTLLRPGQQPPPVQATASLHAIDIAIGGSRFQVERESGRVVLGGDPALAAKALPFTPWAPRVEPVPGGVTLAWSAVRAAERIVIERSPDGRAWSVVGEAAAADSAWRDGTAPIDVPQQYRLRARNAAGDSAPSPAVETMAWPADLRVATSRGDGTGAWGAWTLVPLGRASLAATGAADGPALAGRGIPIGDGELVLAEGPPIDLRSASARIAVRVRCQGVVAARLLIRLADGAWYASQEGINGDRRTPVAMAVAPAAARWAPLDPVTGAVGEMRDLPPGALADVRGIGVRFNAVLNGRWLEVHGLDVRWQPVP